jgi:hypothetical protein
MQKWISSIFFTQSTILHYDFSMLLSFRCKNFRSFREEQELSLIAAKTRADKKRESLIDTPFEDLKLLRCVALYGANASGKSNVLDALATFRRIISNSWRSWKPDGPIPEFDPFLLDESSQKDTTSFELTFLLKAHLYRYGFSYDRQKFTEEFLIDATGRNDRILFFRSPDSETIRFPGRNLWSAASEKRHLQEIARDISARPNSLFLSAAAQRAFPLLLEIYSYLTKNFKPLHWKNMENRQRYTAEMCADEEFCKRIHILMRFADAGIVDIKAIHRDFPEEIKKKISIITKALKENDLRLSPDATDESLEFPSIPEVKMIHTGAGGHQYPLDESKESDGTEAFFSALGPILDALSKGETLLIDELESSLHPMLSRRFIQIFNSPEFNPNGAQFIFTTHNSNLLNPPLLSRDQIWFTEKSNEGATKLYPLTDYQPRTNQNIELGYLGGRFGATPFLDEQLLREALILQEPDQASLNFSAESK